jgi:hypothetical protein
MQVTYNERAHFTVAGVVLVETNIVASNSESIGHLLQLLLTAPPPLGMCDGSIKCRSNITLPKLPNETTQCTGVQFFGTMEVSLSP